MKVKELLKKGINKVAENKELIGVTILGLGMLAFSIKYDIPISGRRTGSVDRDIDDLFFSNSRSSGSIIARTPDEAKILTLGENAKTLSFDSQKKRIAKDISEIAGGSIDSSAQMIAVMTLRDIIKTCSFDSTKREIMEMIRDI